MKLAYFDCYSGVSGDMTLGALLDCLDDSDAEAEFRAQLARLNFTGYELVIQKVTREGLTATDVDVQLSDMDHGHGRHLSDISDILKSSTLSQWVITTALTVFTRLADAEAKIHGTSRDKIHFHEVGAIDAIVDIVGSCILLEMLGIERVYASPLPCGYGTVTCQHGVIPIPAPATLELLQGFPIRSVDIEGELVTPTGAAILTTLAGPERAGRMPNMRVLTNGFGAGKKQFLPNMANLLRVIIGEVEETSDQTIIVLETNLDDERPETLGYLMERCLEANAMDVFYTPIQMKKNRPGVIVTILCTEQNTEALTEIIFRETGTLGVRQRQQTRAILERLSKTVKTPYGEIAIKQGRWRGEEVTAAPEYEDCRRAALEHKVPLKQVYTAALQAYKAPGI